MNAELSGQFRKGSCFLFVFFFLGREVLTLEKKSNCILARSIILKHLYANVAASGFYFVLIFVF